MEHVYLLFGMAFQAFINCILGYLGVITLSPGQQLILSLMLLIAVGVLFIFAKP